MNLRNHKFSNSLSYASNLLDDEIDEFVLEHRFRMKVCDEKRDIVTMNWLSP